MEVGDWITLGAVIVALGIGTLSLWQNQRIQKRQYKRQLCNEITQWANDVISNWLNMNVDKECTLRQNINENLFWNWRDVSARSESVEIAAKYFREDICTLVKDIDSLILDITEFIRSARRGEVTLDFPKEIPKKELANKFGFNDNIVHEAEDGRKMIDIKELIHEELGKLYELTCKLLESVRKIEIKEIGI